jgi:hypothetical protein
LNYIIKYWYLFLIFSYILNYSVSNSEIKNI